jgi:hypothetical protein
VRLTVDDWVASDGILPASARIEPAYAYLLQGAEIRQTVTLRVPAHLAAGATLTTTLRFPGIGETGVALTLTVLAPGEPGAPLPALEVPLDIALPIGEEPAAGGGDEFGSVAQASYCSVFASQASC